MSQVGIFPSEYDEQIAVAAWCDLRRLVWCHCPNETQASPKHHCDRVRAGVRAGVPDVLIFTPPPKDAAARGVAIELKRRDNARVTAQQQYWLDSLQSCGWLARVCRGANEAIQWLHSLGY